MKDNTELRVFLKISTQDILMAINKKFTDMSDEVSVIIENELKEFDYEQIIKKQVQQEINNVIHEVVSSYVRYGEGGNLIKDSIQKLLKNTIEKIVFEKVKEELDV